jgi:hypothetical protein
MRVLVIGYPLPNPQIDNFNAVTSPSWFDYDGVLVEPLSISTVIEDVLTARVQHETRADEPVLNRPPTPFSVGLADVLRRRRAETQHVLQNGGSIIVFARPNAVHEGVAGFPGADRYGWLPAPAGVVYDPPFMIRADGSEVEPTDEAHPFAPLLRRHRGQLAYRIRFDENTPGFSSWGRVIARSSGGAAVGVELDVLGGKVIFLPAIGAVSYGDQRFQLADALIEAMRRLSGRRSGPPPSWVRNFALPNTEVLDSAAAEARDELAQAQERLTRVEDELAQATRLRGLLWLESPDELEPVVREAFRTIGFDVEQSPDRPLWIGDGAVRALVEVEGASGAVDAAPYVRLSRRLETDLLSGNQPKRGIVVVNGQREIAPENRTAQFSETLKLACESRRLALLTTPRLFEMARAVLQEPLDAVRRSVMRAQLLNAAGVVGPEIVPQPPEPEPEPEPSATDSAAPAEADQQPGE